MVASSAHAARNTMSQPTPRNGLIRLFRSIWEGRDQPGLIDGRALGRHEPGRCNKGQNERPDRPGGAVNILQATR